MIEADLVDHLFNSSEKLLARALLLLARYGDQGGPERRIPKISQETLAEMIGTTRSRVNFFMNRFRDLGFIHNVSGNFRKLLDLWPTDLARGVAWSRDGSSLILGLIQRSGDIFLAERTDKP